MIAPWPEKPMFSELPEMHDYERARAEAAISRLKLAVEALKNIQEFYLAPRADAAKALAQIGEIPPAC